MGIGPLELEFLLASRRAGVDFSRVLTLGRQDLFVRPRPLAATVRRFGGSADAAAAKRVREAAGGYADELLARLGAVEAHALDASAFEGANLVHDLNDPVPAAWHGRYDTVIDGGTLEHVFDFPGALASALQLVRPGGHYLAMTPSNGDLGHGFYQFSPELLFRALSPAHGYEVEAAWLGEELIVPGRTRWWEIADPDGLQRRGTFRGRGSQYLFVRARRTGDFSGWAPPHQSDYHSAWQRGSIRERGVLRFRERLRWAGVTGPLTVDRAAFRRIRPEDVVPRDGPVVRL
jgi:SAM-dependent methyltransferase